MTAPTTGSRRSTPPTRSSAIRRSAPRSTATARRRWAASAHSRATPSAACPSTWATSTSTASWATSSARSGSRSESAACSRRRSGSASRRRRSGAPRRSSTSASRRATPAAGSGSAPGARVEACSACNGRGRVRFQQGLLGLAVERPCSRCRGTGRVVTDPCKTCRGAGLLGNRVRTIEVTIPPGIENGATRVVERGGNVTRPDRPPGDLELTIRVALARALPPRRRRRRSARCPSPSRRPRSAASSRSPRSTARVKLRVPPGTQPGAVLRVKGRGIPHRMAGGRGDQLMEVTIEVPTHLTPSQKELIAKLAARARARAFSPSRPRSWRSCGRSSGDGCAAS